MLSRNLKEPLEPWRVFKEPKGSPKPYMRKMCLSYMLTTLNMFSNELFTG